MVHDRTDFLEILKFGNFQNQKMHFPQQAGDIAAHPPKELWLYNVLHSLKKEDQEISFFFNRSGLTIVLWMKRNDEKLVFNQLFNPLLIHKRKSNYRPNLLYKTMFNDSGWIASLSFCSSECTQICYRLQTNLNTIINKTYSVSFI